MLPEIPPGVAQILGPMGVLVVLVVGVLCWALVKRNGKGREARYQELLAKLDGLRPALDGPGEVDTPRYLLLLSKIEGLSDEIGEMKLDVRELRGSVVGHLESHAS